ncbi:MAG: branched-chain amino acid ABC transporter permease [Acidimicrobiia bacterium]|nr:branched-chain amino acid ABC transporter permease [Acidimicrobiia bacterium]
MTQFLQATINGVAVGAIYALLALGFVIIYKSTQVLSFAQQGLTVLGAFWVVYFSTVLDLNFWIALVFALALSAAVGIGIERVMLRPMVGKPVFSVAILTIGLNIVLLVIAFDLIGVNIRSMGDPWGLKSLSIGDLTISHKDLATIVTAALVVGLLLAFFRYSRFGLAMRAVAADQEVALAQGVRVTRVNAAAWAIAAALATLAGLFLGAGTGLAPAVGTRAIRALPAAVIGGLDSIAGAIVGGLLIGLIEAYMVTYQSQYLSFLGANFANVVAWALMFLVLLVRPSGLFGTVEVERV